MSGCVMTMVVGLCVLGGSLCADGHFESGYATEKEAEERDMDALRDYINTKRAITVKEKGGNLMISGDIRGEWYHIKSKVNNEYQRGWKSRNLFPNSYVNKKNPTISHRKFEHRSFRKRVEYREGRDEIRPPYASNEFDAEANLILDYVSDRGWAAIQLQLSNPAGINIPDREPMINDDRRIMYGSGKLNDLALRKCYAGYNVSEEGVSRFDLEVGRRRLYDVFDSKIEFWSYFDGLLARFTTSVEHVLDLSCKAAAFVVDYNVNHYGYVGELGMYNLGCSGLDFEYSLIDWNTLHKPNRFERRHAMGTQFLNSQVVVNYNFNPDIVGIKTNLYAAYLLNHAARATGWTHHRKARDAYYVGGCVGEVVHKGDYSLELIYQWVRAQAVPETDLSTSSRDNPRGISFYNRRSGGGGNFRGWRLEGLYAVTDNWTLNAYFDRLRQMDDHIGGKYQSWQFYFGAIFAF